MSTHRTTKIVLAAILLAKEEGKFRLPDLKEHPSFPEDSPANSTIRLVLRQMEESGWLRRSHPEGRIWYAGERIDELE